MRRAHDQDVGISLVGILVLALRDRRVRRGLAMWWGQDPLFSFGSEKRKTLGKNQKHVELLLFYLLDC